MTIADLIKDFIDSARERIKTPISGAFLWAFIIFNWRPLVFLIFSKESIENRIIVINYEYFHWWAIVVPILMAIVYTIGLPMLMLRIEKILKKTRKGRLDNRNEYIGHQKDGKILLADKEWILKNAESGNKEIQDHLDEIKSLKEQIESQKESIKQINETNKVTVDELNSSLKKANSIKSDMIKHTDRYKFDNLHNTVVGDTINLDQQLADEIVNAGDTLTFDEFQVLKVINANDKESVFFTQSKDHAFLLDSLAKKKILNYQTSGKNYEVSLTQIGLILSDIIQST